MGGFVVFFCLAPVFILYLISFLQYDTMYVDSLNYLFICFVVALFFTDFSIFKLGI